MAEHLFAASVPDSIYAVDGWLLRTTLAGGIILLVGSLWMLLTRQPAQRQRLGELSLLAALLVALPAALPTWWSIPSFDQHPATQKAIFGNSHQSAQDTLPRDEQALQKVLVAAQDYWEDGDLPEIDILTLLNSLPAEKTQPQQDDANTIKQPERQNDSDTKGLAIPFTSTAWFRWTLRTIGIAYIGLVLLLLARCTLGYYGLWRYWRQRRPAPAHVHSALAELEPNPARRPRIGVNNLVHGPVSYGLWKPTILLPPSFCNEGDPDKLRWILAHELTHLRRRDAWGCMLLALGGALYFHLPWFWWMKRHVRLAQEYLADAAAVKFTNAVEYAQYLVSLTTLASRPTLASSQAAGVFENPSDLYRRVHMLLHQRSVLERSTPRWWTLTAAASFLTLAACTSGIKLYADEPDKKEVEVVVVGDDGGKADKKVTVKVNGKIIDGDGNHHVVIVTDDDEKGEKKPKIVRGFELSNNNKAKIDEALKRLDAALDKLPRQIDGDTRKQLEELKKTLQAMKEQGPGALWAVGERQEEVKGRLLELKKNAADDVKRNVELHQLHMKLAQDQAAKAKDHALAAEKMAKAAQEKALARWTDAKDGKEKDAAIKALEAAIADKEKALKDLKMAESRRRIERTETTRTAVTSSKGRLGVVVADIDSTLRGHLDLNDNQGLMIQEVIEPSPAWNNGNGLRSSDILVELAGKKVTSNQEQFREMVSKLSEGNISAVVIRKGKKMTINGIKLPAAEKATRVTYTPVAPADTDKVTITDRLNNIAKVQDVTIVKPENVVIDLVKPDDLQDNVKLDRVVKLTDVPLVQTVPGNLILTTKSTAPTVTQLVKTAPQQAASKPRLGLMLEAVPELVASQVELAEDRGLFVTEVVDGTPAKKAGFQKNDILIEFADQPVTRDHAAFTKAVRELKAGKYTATVIRKGKEIRLRDITLPDAKAAAEEQKAKVKEWVVEGDNKNDEAKVKEKVKEAFRDKKKDDFFPNAGNRAFFRQGGNTSITLNNDQFTAKSTVEGKTITVVGKMTAGKAEPSSITIKTDDGEKKFKSLKEVPAEDKAQVEKLLSSFKGNNFQFGNFNGFRFNGGAFDKQFEEQMKLLEKQLEQLGEGNPGFEELQKHMEQMRKQLRNLNRNRNDDDDSDE
ncbi:MAG: M56 family metallopeptidase [Gemmatales bacterium]